VRLEELKISVRWSDREKAFVATVAEFPTVSAHGTTKEKAIEALRVAVEGCAVGMAKIGLSVPGNR
jgi:predicted RNase H-like HicB family nuclease